MSAVNDDMQRFRIRLVLFLCFIGLFCLIAKLWSLQVVKGHQYSKNIAQQSMRRIRIPEMRGRIYDRNLKIIADNRPSHCIAIYIEEVRQKGRWKNTVDHIFELMKGVARKAEIPMQLKYDDVEEHVRTQRYLPLLAWKDIDEAAIARFSERINDISGMSIYTEAYREYPYKDLACHAIGYVGRGGLPEEGEESYNLYLPQMIGKSGIELIMDEELRGEAGGELLRVDVSGIKHETLGHRDPKNGKDLQLTIDAEVQRLAEEVLSTEVGAICIVEPFTGDVLAMASYPRYDLNRWIPKASTSFIRSLTGDSRGPFNNRVSGGEYAPGSTFKPLVCIAALESDKVSPNQSYHCPGYFMLGNLRMHCGYRNGHGTLNMRQAIERSCNVYFYKLGLEIGYDHIYHTAAALGFGAKTGIESGSDRAGLLPDNFWKREKKGDSWRDGDTANISIGQGYLMASPLQMAMYTAAVANGGILYRPRLIKGKREPGNKHFREILPEAANIFSWSSVTKNIVMGGMRDVVMSDRGTARNAQVVGLEYAGKTGTAQFGKRSEKKYRAWMVAFAPYKNPKYAISLVIEEGGSSSVSASPKMKELLEKLFGLSGESTSG